MCVLPINYYNHQSVLLEESIQLLNINPKGFYIDGTFGLGGHSKLILSKLDKSGRLLGVDRDLLAVKFGECMATQDGRFTIIHSSFSKIKNYIENMGCVHLVNGILLDLGISTLQLNDISRGFSFTKDGPLDMRMDISTGQSAAYWLSHASQQEIFWVLRNFGEEKFAKRISKIVVEKRQNTPILRSCTLSKLISSVVPTFYGGYQKHPATRSFLAIRIYINQELKELMQILQDALEILSVNGRLVIISFNSLEDRLVKFFIRKHSNISIPFKIPLTDIEIFDRYQSKCQLRNVTKVMPSNLEIKRNARSRSAVLRCAEKLFI